MNTGTYVLEFATTDEVGNKEEKLIRILIK